MLGFNNAHIHGLNPKILKCGARLWVICIVKLYARNMRLKRPSRPCLSKIGRHPPIQDSTYLLQTYSTAPKQAHLKPLPYHRIQLRIMADVSGLEEDIKQYREQVRLRISFCSVLRHHANKMQQLEVVHAGLKDDPGNAELLALKSELDDALDLLSETLAELKPSKAPSKPKAPSPPLVQEKWSRENHPAFKKAAQVEEKEVDAGPVNYQVNDTVMAKWVSGDKGFYPARITSITGSSSTPIYVVKFKSYDNTEQLGAKDIRPVAQKRKAEGTPTTNTTPSATPSQPLQSSNPVPGVISAAASINPELAQKNREPSEKMDADGKPKFKKIKATKELEKGKNKWQEFNTKSKFAKNPKAKKDSMFRTPEGVHGRGWSYSSVTPFW
jgi:survival-of-motor-neuron-related-splicing factor 30